MIQGMTMLEIDNAIFKHLRENHPDFVFGIRTSKDTNGRLQAGYKFQGDVDHYLSIGLVTTNGGFSATKAINLEYETNRGIILYINTIPITDNTIKNCYTDIANKLQAIPSGKILSKKYCDKNDLNSIQDIFDVLDRFIEGDYKIIKWGIQKTCPSQIWTPKQFQDQLDKSESRRQSLVNSQTVTNPQPTSSVTQKSVAVPATNTGTKHPLNLILYGPPGTGKTYDTIYEAVSIIEDKSIEELKDEKHEDVQKRFNGYKSTGNIVFTTFHQSLSYEEFIEGIKPIPFKGDIEAEHSYDKKTGKTEIKGLERMKYEVKDGIFKKLAEEAKGKSENYVLIIDEINRGNVSRIFGELITLIEKDKRLGNAEGLTVKLPYTFSIKPDADEFGVPNNLYIIGTMNTADRSVEALDTALRRRFSFKEIMPNPDLVDRDIPITNTYSVNLKNLMGTINSRILRLKDREHQIGHSYFMKCNNADDLKSVFKDNIIPLLQEYFFGNYAYIGCVLGNGFVKEEENSSKLRFANGFSFDDSDEKTYRLLNDEEWENLNQPDDNDQTKTKFEIALRALLN